MQKIINPSQSALIPSRTISDNNLLSHDPLRSFYLKRGQRRMCIKIDIRKAFNSIRWDSIEAALHAFDFPIDLVNWNMECITQPAFSVLVNGTPCGVF